jgi:autotransporter-associated beta strand protein
MKKQTLPRHHAALSGALALGFLALTSGSQAQVATWTGVADTDWNNPNNWDLLAVPAEGTNAVLGAGVTVDYTAPMAATAFGTLTSSGVLNVSAAGFNSAGGTAGFTGSGALFQINSGGLASLTGGGLQCASSAATIIEAGGSLAVSGTVALGASGNVGFLTNRGGVLSCSTLTVNPNNANANGRALILGGVNDLGTVNVLRSGSSSFLAIGSEGLIISNGVVRMTTLNVGTPAANSHLTCFLGGGIVTNRGDMTVRQATSGRAARFLQTGGLFVGEGVNGARVGVTNAGQVAIFSVIGGTNIIEKFLLGDLTNNSGTVNFTNGGTIVVGSGGISSNLIQNLNVVLNNNGTFAAKADWTGSVAMLLNGGTFTFRAADLDGMAHNITLDRILRGSGALNKTGGGILTLNAANTYSGSTTINEGTLALGANGSLASGQILVGSGATYDVTALGGYTVGTGQTLGGSGLVLGAVSVTAGSLAPGLAGAPGTLTLANGLTQSGGIDRFDLTDDPTGMAKPNDKLIVTGDLSLSGTVTLLVNPLEPLPGGAVYPLIEYSGSLLGSLANFNLSGTAGKLTNWPGVIAIVTESVRGPASLAWVGSGITNDWDLLKTTNWLNGGVLDKFVTGDAVTFDATGATHPNVNLAGLVAPAAITVDAADNYTFAGPGGITGPTRLTKTNTGTLTVLSTNDYTGPTIVGQGTLAAGWLALAGAASSIGAAGTDPTNLVLIGSMLSYVGPSASTDRGVTLETGGTIGVTNPATTLAIGTLAGSGPLTKTGPGTLTLTADSSFTNGTLITGGTVRLNTLGGLGGGGITNQDSVFRVALAGTIPNSLDFTGDCTVDLSNVGGDSALNGAWSGSGTVNVVNQQNASRTLTVGGNGSSNGSGSQGNALLFSGTINMGTNSGFLRFNDGGGNHNFGSTNLTIDLGSSTATFLVRNGGITIDLGEFRGGPATRLYGRGSGNSGTVIYSIGAKGTSALFEGAVVNGNNATAIMKVGGGTWTLSGISTYTGPTIVSEGVLALTGAGTIGSTLTIDLSAGSTLDVSGRTDGTLGLNSPQVLTGEGTVLGSVTVLSGATVSPGENLAGSPAGSGVIGVLTITNTLVLQAGSAVWLDLDGSSLTNDVIRGLAQVTYGGTLNLSGYPGVAGQVFKLFDAAVYAGAFAAINPPTPGYGLEWDLSKLAVDGTIRVVPQRARIGTLTLGNGQVIVSGTNGLPNATYYLLSSTNVALPLAQWQPLGTNQFSWDGSFSETNAVNPAEGGRFYLLQQP